MQDSGSGSLTRAQTQRLHWEREVLTTGPPGKSQQVLLFNKIRELTAYLNADNSPETEINNKRVVVALAVQLLNHVQFFSIPWTAALEAPLSFTISWSLLKLMSIELVMPSNHLIFCLPLLLLLSILLASEKRGDSLAFWTFFWHFHCQGRVCSLVRKLRSHKPPRAPPTNKKKKRYILYA